METASAGGNITQCIILATTVGRVAPIGCSVFCLPELTFAPHFLKIVVEVKALGPPHILRLWWGSRPWDRHIS